MSSRSGSIISGIAIFVVALGLAGATPEAWAQKPVPRGPNGEQIVKTLGGRTTRFYRTPINSVDALKKMAAAMRTDLGVVLSDAELTAITSQVMDALTTGAVTETTVAVGQQMQWMAMRRKGKIDLIRNLSWGGKAPFAAYKFTVKTETAEYEFVVPKLCGNLSLVRTTAIAPVVAPVVVPPPTAAPPPPVVAPVVAPVVVPPPVVERPVVETPVVVAPVIPPPPQPAGVSRLSPFVMAAFGKQRRTLSFDENVGVAAFCDPLFGIKGGLQFQVKPHFMIAPALGVAINLDEGDRTSVFADLELNYTFDNGGYVGSGFGVWDINHSENRTGNLMFQFGVPLVKRPAGPSNLLFAFESRLFLDEMDNVKNNYQFWAGVRYVFR